MIVVRTVGPQRFPYIFGATSCSRIGCDPLPARSSTTSAPRSTASSPSSATLPGCPSGSRTASAVEIAGPLKNGARFKARFGTRLTEFEIVDFAPPNRFGGGTTPAHGLEDVLSTRFRRRIYLSHRQRRVDTALPRRVGAGSAATEAGGAAPPESDPPEPAASPLADRKSTRLNSSH